MEQQIPPKSDVDIVGDYHPTDFGFNGYQRNRRPMDYFGDKWPQ
jgi:hypothetical protein